jgi:hypothetical protein
MSDTLVSPRAPSWAVAVGIAAVSLTLGGSAGSLATRQGDPFDIRGDLRETRAEILGEIRRLGDKIDDARARLEQLEARVRKIETGEQR